MSNLNPARILIVDDEPIARDALEALLFSPNYEIYTAVDGSDAISQIDLRPPDVILLDVMMPGMNGYQVCENLKNHPLYRHIPIIMVTALSDKEDLARGLDAGADEFLSKPVSGIELQARVRSMLRIKRQYDELTLLLKMREDMSHMLVHDMRNPLSLIMGFTERLRMATDIPAEHQKRLEKVDFHAKRLNNLIDELLTMAQMEGGHLVLHRSIVDLAKLVNQSATDHRPIAENRSIQIDVETPEEPCLALADRPLITRVIDNLVSNAIKFSPAKSSLLLRVQVNGHPDQELVHVQVIDQGPGIPEEHQQAIFEKFKIVEMKQRGVSQIGLGLAFCKLVMDAHEGGIVYSPNQPVGSIFTLTLKAQAQPATG